MGFEAKTKLIAEIAGRLLATQFAQIQIWRADDVDLDRLADTCTSLAAHVVVRAEKELADET
jgi:hypothetical protein